MYSECDCNVIGGQKAVVSDIPTVYTPHLGCNQPCLLAVTPDYSLHTQLLRGKYTWMYVNTIPDTKLLQ